MKRLGKTLRFIQFTLDGKLPCLAKKMETTELSELYVEFAPLFYEPANPRDAAMGSLVVYTVAAELKARYPRRAKIQAWNPLEKVNLNEIIGV